MTFSAVMEQIGIELLVFAVCLFFGLRLIITKDIKIIKKDDPDSIKHPEEYAKYAGFIILFLGVATLIMAALSFISPLAAMIEIIAAVIAMGIMWKFMHERFS
ncbi:hypothetical protein [Butyrivibrio proteoclasticus]|uniref:hypothetical protein n=1 Tax=Butyrivibrio proteoclasticus TaxID=43305 RepID=UPI000478D7D6|nr:hypothetical protein [Butyrivibrio proteoclasticus]